MLDVYLDDITVAKVGAVEANLVVELAGAFRDIKDVVEDDLGARIHPAKTQVISSSRVVTDRLGRLCAGRPASLLLDSYTLLGTRVCPWPRAIYIYILKCKNREASTQTHAIASSLS